MQPQPNPRGVCADYAGDLLDQPGEPAQRGGRGVRPKGQMTEREIDVVRLIASGASNRTIAEKLGVSRPTVKSHIAHIMNKLDVSSLTRGAARARELKII